MIMTASALLFDLDGVLVDSTPAVTRVWTGWAIEHGFEPEKTVREAHGRPSIETIRELLPGADHEAAEPRTRGREIADLDGVVPLPGAIELLNSAATQPLGNRHLMHPRPRRGPHSCRRTAGATEHGHLQRHHQRQAESRAVPEGGQSAQGWIPPIASFWKMFLPASVPARAAGARVVALRTTATDEELRSRRSPDWILDNCAAISPFRSGPFHGLLRLSFSSFD